MTSTRNNDWHAQSITEVCQRLKTSLLSGLSHAGANDRLGRVGSNELTARPSRTLWHMLAEQLRATLVLILIAAAAISLLLGEVVDAIAIATIVILNAVLGVSQERRAERAIRMLTRLAAPQVRVKRDGRLRSIAAQDLVPGDIVQLEAGDRVPADARVLESANLRVDEAALTGESLPVDKSTAVLGDHTVLAERRNMAYMGTSVVYGRGLAVIVTTGMATELGRVAHLLEAVERLQTPLQRRLGEVGHRLTIAAVGLIGVVVALGLAQGHELRVVFLTAVTLAVAAVPEGLPAIVTIALALGAQRMLRRQALIRRLPAVETLGSVTVICSDKTGTLTANRMSVVEIHSGNSLLTQGSTSSLGGAPTRDRSTILAAAALCTDARTGVDSATGAAVPVGDPTETALVDAAARHSLSKEELEQACPRVAEVPFDSSRKRMTTVHENPTPANPTRDWPFPWDGQPLVAFTKGASETVLSRCSHVLLNDEATVLTALQQEQLHAANEQLAGRGIRVLAIAFKTLDTLPSNGLVEPFEKDLTFVGLIGLSDPIRPEAKVAVSACGAAGIRPVMITGDHPLTARQIAIDLGLESDGLVLTGSDLANLSPAQLDETIRHTSVYARVLPEQKLDIVRAFQRRGAVTAMTGDGINDAPALRQADIGVAMGLVGTDVAREAADVVLQDDNFATVVAAVQEGRVIYDNIRKFLRYILSSNVGEILVMVAGPLLGMPLPLLPVQILWINLVTDGLPALALSLEPAEPGTLQRPPYPISESVFARGTGRYIVLVGMAVGTVSIFAAFEPWSNGDPSWQTMVFTTLTLAQLAQVLAVRSTHRSILRTSLVSNPALLASVVVAVSLQMLVVYSPVLQPIFQTVPLAPQALLTSIALSGLVVGVVELEKRWP